MKKISLLISIIFLALIGLSIIYLIRVYKHKLPYSTFIKPTPKSQFSAWIPYWDQDRAFDSFDKSSKKISIFSPVWYFINAEGKVFDQKNIDQNKFINKAQQNDIKLLPTISNQSDYNKITKLINDSLLIEQFKNELVKIAQNQNYQGWDIDFEEIKLKDKEAFSNFIGNLAQFLHKNNLLLSVSVHAQRKDKIEREAAQAQDWKKLASSADFIRIMAYDFHNTNTEPGSITPLGDYKLVIEKALENIPVEKIVISLPLYGYDWGGNNNTSTDYLKSKELAEKIKRTFIRDKDSNMLILNYQTNNVNRQIWVEDVESAIAKINLARSFGVYQFCFWRLGGEDQKLWEKL